MIYLAPKNVDDVTDYQIDFASLLPANFELANATVTVVASGNTESPIALEAMNPTTGDNVSPAISATVVLFWLQGGTAKIWYLVKVQVEDTQSGNPRRKYTRYAKVQVRDDL
jgi:hypothetical protein